MSLKSKIQGWRDDIQEWKGERRAIQNRLDGNKSDLLVLEENLRATSEAKEIIHIVAKLTQEDLEFYLADLVSTGLASIFPDPYELEVEFESKRGKIEVPLMLKDGDILLDPKRSVGDGVQDSTGLALRFSCLAIASVSDQATRPIIILDEPLRGLKGKKLPEKGAQMIKQISEKIGIQIIMISHDSELIEHGDRIFEVTKKDGISQVRRI